MGKTSKGKASGGERARADKGAWARAILVMANDNGKQQERALDNRAAQ